jgi:hypothetical protein
MAPSPPRECDTLTLAVCGILGPQRFSRGTVLISHVLNPRAELSVMPYAASSTVSASSYSRL